MPKWLDWLVGLRDDPQAMNTLSINLRYHPKNRKELAQALRALATWVERKPPTGPLALHDSDGDVIGHAELKETTT